jgi:hypothetical protein
VGYIGENAKLILNVIALDVDCNRLKELNQLENMGYK